MLCKMSVCPQLYAAVYRVSESSISPILKSTAKHFYYGLLCPEKSLGNVFPSEIRQIAVDVIGKVAAVGRERTGDTFDHALQSAQFSIHPIHRIIATQQVLYGSFYVRRLYHEHPTGVVRLLFCSSRLLPQLRVDLDDHPVNREWKDLDGLLTSLRYSITAGKPPEPDPETGQVSFDIFKLWRDEYRRMRYIEKALDSMRTGEPVRTALSGRSTASNPVDTLLADFRASIAELPQEAVTRELSRELRYLRQRRHALGSDDPARQFGQDCRLIAAACTKFEDLLVAGQLQFLSHQSDDVGLRNRLRLSDRQRGVVVRRVSVALGNEQMPGDSPHAFEDPRVLDPPGLDLSTDHVLPLHLPIRFGGL